MSVKISVRLPDSLGARIAELAGANGSTTSQEIVSALERAFLAQVQPEPSLKAKVEPIRATLTEASAILATMPWVKPASTLPARPKHAETCPCFTCHPENASK